MPDMLRRYEIPMLALWLPVCQHRYLGAGSSLAAAFLFLDTCCKVLLTRHQKPILRVLGMPTIPSGPRFMAVDLAIARMQTSTPGSPTMAKSSGSPRLTIRMEQPPMLNLCHWMHRTQGRPMILSLWSKLWRQRKRECMRSCELHCARVGTPRTRVLLVGCPFGMTLTSSGTGILRMRVCCQVQRCRQQWMEGGSLPRQCLQRGQHGQSRMLYLRRRPWLLCGDSCGACLFVLGTAVLLP